MPHWRGRSTLPCSITPGQHRRVRFPAMTYDRIVGAIGPFEWSEYLGLAVICASLAVTAPVRTGARTVQPGTASSEPGSVRGARPA